MTHEGAPGSVGSPCSSRRCTPSGIGETACPGPFVYIGTFEIREGKLEEPKRAMNEVVNFVQGLPNT
jgi:hypothetical protein